MKKNKYKNDFPIFSSNEGIIYLDSAATTQKPRIVIEEMVRYYSDSNSNVHRGAYPLADKSTTMYEHARQVVADFINANPDEIIFIPSSTLGLNLLAMSLTKIIAPNDTKILISDFEHSSNFLPWIEYFKEAEFDFLTIDSSSMNFDYASLNRQNDIISLSHMSNVTGEILDVSKIREENPESILILDASQSIAHNIIDVKKLKADALVFSGHKIYGPMGIGVMYLSRKLARKLEYLSLGGGMVDDVRKDRFTLKDAPYKFESGTPNVAGAVGLAKALEYINTIGMTEIHSKDNELTNYLLKKLSRFESIKIVSCDAEKNGGIVTFYSHKVHAHDISFLLGQSNICTRAGNHCTQILHKEALEIPPTVRISFGVYNDLEDVDILIDKLDEIFKQF